MISTSSLSTDSFIPSKHQVAGHDGCLTSESLFIKSTTKQEIDFYQETILHDSKKENSNLGDLLSHWMPTFMGTLTEGENVKESEKIHMVLSNSYYGFNYPSILDIKLGSKLTDDLTTTKDKVERLAKVSKSTTSGSLNFRICGMKVFNGFNHQKPKVEFYENMNDSSVSVIIEESKHYYLEFNRIYGKSLNESNIKKGIYLFFNESHLGKEIIKKLLGQFLKRLQILYNCLLDKEIRVFSGSLLFIYESDLKRWQGVNDDNYDDLDPLINENLANLKDEEDEDEEGVYEEIIAPLSSLQLIDFAHARYVPGKGYDENIIQGIENLIEIFQQLIEEN
ncbi:unnamed protein product [Candida verbasci]|uniref:Kinase n=1 Tax=Candida verbasci TaxID=1227364 RepID=A0A9W4XA83_9ASCO|nr:unnamed protein product [Candida verbasci]